MVKRITYLMLIFLLFSACQKLGTESTFTPTLELILSSTLTSTHEAIQSTSITPNTPLTLSTQIPSISSTVEREPIATNPSPFTIQPVIIQPIIHEQPGEIYETVFSIPVGDDSLIQYLMLAHTIEGPNALAVLPDDSFMIADSVANRLLQYEKSGRLMNIIELDDLGIRYTRDLRIKGKELFLLETSYQRFRVHHLSLDGVLISSDEIPYIYLLREPDYTLEGGLTGISIDCENKIILEIEGGSRLFPLSEVQSQTSPDNIKQGYHCNSKLYRVINPGPKQTPRIIAGDIIYETQLTKGLGGFSLLDVFPDGSFYVDLDDVVNDQVIQVDKTVHYIDSKGSVLGFARVPLSEYYYSVMREIAINSKGEVFALLPRQESVDIIILNFYRHLESLIPGVSVPEITINTKNPY